jgi:glycosyltransferase involved in cell wall biosynthesis
MRASILIPTFRRDELLNLGLQSIVRQDQDVEIIVLNDSEPADSTKTIANNYGCRYIQCRDSVNQWRVPGFAFNIGVKQSSSDIVILTCPEIWHHDPCVDGLITAVENDKYALATGAGKDDKRTYVRDDDNSFNRLRNLNCRLPFLMAVDKEIFINIGGYDEDFTGTCYDDNDIMERLIKSGCHHHQTEDRFVHLYHNRHAWSRQKIKSNVRLYRQRRGQIVRNQNKEWGIL